MRSRDHWQRVYDTKAADEVSWYAPHLARSIAFVQETALAPDARIVDIGGGASTFVDDLLEIGFRNVAVLDLADSSLNVARQRLGERAAEVDWIVGDATESILPERSVDFWHDRAAFHFLTDEDARSAYLGQVRRAVKPGGRVLVATFGIDGPEQCSGLPVVRYDADGIHAAFGDTFEKLSHSVEQHATPWGTEQSFVYCFCRRT